MHAETIHNPCHIWWILQPWICIVQDFNKNVTISALKMLSTWLVALTFCEMRTYACSIHLQNHWIAQGSGVSATWVGPRKNIHNPCHIWWSLSPTCRNFVDFARNVTISALKHCSKWLPGQITFGEASGTIKIISKPLDCAMFLPSITRLAKIKNTHNPCIISWLWRATRRLSQEFNKNFTFSALKR